MVEQIKKAIGGIVIDDADRSSNPLYPDKLESTVTKKRA